jgi:hypothetical protein
MLARSRSGACAAYANAPVHLGIDLLLGGVRPPLRHLSNGTAVSNRGEQNRAGPRPESHLLPLRRIPDGPGFEEVLACEEEPRLGNGGLGRLAACYLDSLATLERPAIGYGIRYEFGIFDQEIHDGWQVEKTDNWLVNLNPSEIPKPDVNYLVNWGAYVEHYTDYAGDDRARWIPGRVIKGVAGTSASKRPGCPALRSRNASADMPFRLRSRVSAGMVAGVFDVGHRRSVAFNDVAEMNFRRA